MKNSKRGIACLLVLPLLLLGCPLEATAAPAPEEASAPSGSAAAGRAAAEKLVSAGLTPEEASARVAAMSPAEIAHAASPDVEIRRGGDGVFVLLVAILVGILVFAMLSHHHGAHD